MNYTWRNATLADVTAVVKMAQQHFESEIDTIFTPEPVVYARNITVAVHTQQYFPTKELLAVAYNPENPRHLLAYTWIAANEVAAWSDDRISSVRIAHVDLSVSARTRIKLVNDMIEIWENFARYADTPILCSTTMRNDQQAFLKLHLRAGYDIRGSYAYKRIDLKATQ